MTKNFLIRFAQAIGAYLVIVLMHASTSALPVGSDYLFRVGYILGMSWHWGLLGALVLAALSRSRKGGRRI